VGKLVEYGFSSTAETRSFAADIYAKVPRKGRGISVSADSPHLLR
jgi:pre-mRNA-splicing factor ATP-dependent RNA helicase DHX16